MDFLSPDPPRRSKPGKRFRKNNTVAPMPDWSPRLPPPRAPSVLSPTFEQRPASIHVTRVDEALSVATRLRGLIPSDGRLLPEFSQASFSYILNVGAWTEQVQFECQPFMPRNTEVLINQEKSAPIKLLPLAAGTTKVIITVLSTMDRTATNYFVEVVRGKLPPHIAARSNPQSRSLPPRPSRRHEVEFADNLEEPEYAVPQDRLAPPGSHQRILIREATPSPSPPPSDVEHYTVREAFRAASHEQMTLQPGEMIAVTQKQGLWWSGFKLPGEGEVDTAPEAGWFPGECLASKDLLHDASGYLSPRSEPVYEQIREDVSEPPSLVLESRDSFYDVFSFKPKRNKLAWPWITVLSVMLQILLLTIMSASNGLAGSKVNPMIGPNEATLHTYGARSFTSVRNGDVHRLISPIIVPVGFIRFAFDALFHLMVCLPLERILGNLRFGLIYIIAGIGGNLVALLFLPLWVGAGPGGAMFGCAGCLLTLMFLNTKDKKVQVGKDMIFTLVLMVAGVVLGLFPGLDNWSQVGGLFFGFMVALIFIPRSQRRMAKAQKRRLRIIGTFTLFMSLLAGLVLLYVFVEEEDACRWCMSATCIDTYQWCSRTLRLVEQ